MAGYKPSPFGFSLPPLPKETYLKLRELRAKYDLPSLSVVVMGLELLYQLEGEHPDGFQKLMTKLKTPA